MKKQHFLLADIESTIDGLAADIGFCLSDRKGNILMTHAVLVQGIYNDPDAHCLFYNEQAGSLWSQSRLNDRYTAYENMLLNGSRVMGTIHSINNWLMMIKAQYDPILTAYNLPFDLGKARDTGINLDHFNRRFCLWSACVTAFAKTKKYRQFVLDNHLFTNRTDYGNMSYRTNAEVMTRFVLGDLSIPDEPHTSLEDVMGYEKPLLDKLLKAKSTKWLLNHVAPYDWRCFQVKDWFKPA